MCSKTKVHLCLPLHLHMFMHQGTDMMFVKGDYVPFKDVVTYQKVLSSLINCTVFPTKSYCSLLSQLHWSFWFIWNNRYLSEAAAGGDSCCRSQVMSTRSMFGLSKLQTASLAKQRPHVQSCTKRQRVWCRRALAWDWKRQFFIIVHVGPLGVASSSKSCDNKLSKDAGFVMSKAQTLETLP